MPDFSNIEADIDRLLGIKPGEAEDTSTTQQPEEAADSNAQQEQDSNATAQQEQAAAPAQVTNGGQAAQPNTNQQQQRDVGTSTNTNTSAQQQQQRQGAPLPSIPRGRYPADARGNLVDPSTGQVIANAGRERTYFEAARDLGQRVTRMQNELQTAQTNLQQYEAQITAYREANAEVQRLGMTPGDATNAVRFLAHYRQDPIAAIKNLLTEAQAAGYNIEGVGVGTDVAAIQRMVQNAVAPLQADREQNIAQQRAVQEADAEIAAVQQSHPWIEQNQDVLMEVLDADPSINLMQAALLVENWALRNGLDVHQPLRAQYQQRGAQQVQQQQVRQPAPTQQFNAARQAPPAMSDMNNVVPRRGAPAAANRSTRDIVREAFAEAGVSLDNL